MATTIASAAGARAPRAMARSTSIQVTSTPRAISGSGRRPLLKASQAARNTAPAVNTAARFPPTPSRPGPRRRSTRWAISSQHAMPAPSAGSRIHTPAVLTAASVDSRLRYQSKGASVAPK